MKKFRLLNSLFAFVFCASLVLTPLANVHAAAISITAANVAVSSDAEFDNGFAGESITAGQIVYKSTTDQRFYLADADAVSPGYKVAGLALHASLAGQPLKIVTKDPNYTPGGTLAPGDVIYAFTTAGAITKTNADITTGNFVTVLGVAISTTKMNLNITRSDVVK